MDQAPVLNDAVEVARCNALNDLEILGSGGDPAFDRLTELAATLFDTDYSFVSFVGPDRQWFKSRHGLSIVESPRSTSFCTHTIQLNEPLVILDTHADERFRLNPFVVDEPRFRFYAGAQVRSADGQNVGTLCIADTQPRTDFPLPAQEALKTMAALASESADAHRLSMRLRWDETERRKRQWLFALASMDGAWDWDLNTDSVYYSPRFQSFLGLPEVQSRTSSSYWLDRVHPKDRPSLEKEIERHLRGHSAIFQNEHRLRHADGRWLWVAARGLMQRGPFGTLSRFTGSLVEITPTKQSDPLTGVANFVTLRASLERACCEQTHAARMNLALFLVDIAGFSAINRQLGHAAGDELLRLLGRRLQNAMPAIRPGISTVVARFGSDRFLILVEGLKLEENCKEITRSLHAAVSRPLTADLSAITLATNIGVAMTGGAMKSADDVLQLAEEALRRAKQNGPRATHFINANPETLVCEGEV
jgi:diguanylate cyclase (GGDEF)-like protein/PAS domain S-box-containing protein